MSIGNIVLRSRGLGWRPNPVDSRDRDIGLMGLAADALHDKVSLRPYVAKVLDQRSTNSCVAHKIAGGIGILETKADLGYSPPSRLFLYFNSRAFHGAQKTDSGTYIRTAVKGLCKFGVPDEKYWKFSSNPLIVNRRPGWNPYMMGFSRGGGEYFWILDSGAARVNAIKAALQAGYPVGFGTTITSTFLKYDGSYTLDRPANSDQHLGGHAMLIIGYEQNEDGLKFEILNSWGDDWGAWGYAWFTEDYITWSLTRDFVIIRGWKRLQQGE